MQLVPIGNDEKFEGSRVVVAGWPNDAAAIVDAGTYYGILRQAGDSHAQALAAVQALPETWRGGESTPPDPRQPVHTGNDVKVRLTDVAVPIIESGEGTDIAAALFDVGTQFGQVVQATGSIDYAFTVVGRWLVQFYGGEMPFPEVAEPTPGQPPRPDPGPTPQPGTATALRVEGNKRWFANDAGKFPWKETTAFGLFGFMRVNPQAAEAWMRQMVGRHRFNLFHALASLPNRGYWGSRAVGPESDGSREAIDRVVNLAGELGAYVRIVLIGAVDAFGGKPQADRRDVYTSEVQRRAEAWGHEIVERTRRHSNVLYIGANEPNEIGMRDSFAKLFNWTSGLKRNVAPDRLFAAGGHTKEGDTVFLRAPMDYNDVHLSRQPGLGAIDTPQGREFWITTKRSGENPNIDQHVMPFVHGEPPNYGEGPDFYGRPFRADIDKSPASAFGMAAMSRARRYNVSFHWDGGLFCDEPGPLAIACMEAYHRGLDAFPMLDSDNLWRGHHAASFFQQGISPPSDKPEDNDNDPMNDVEDWVDSGRGPWRVTGIDNIACTTLESAGLDMVSKAKPGVRVRVVDRVVFGNHAAGVYVRE